jgi:hypothetical protein
VGKVNRVSLDLFLDRQIYELNSPLAHVLQTSATIMKTHVADSTHVVMTQGTTEAPACHAYLLLHWGFIALPVIAGVDKFFMKLTDWSQYLWAPLGNLVGGTHNFMAIVGVVEILAGALVAFKPRIGAYVVAVWLWGIIVNLLLIHNYYDVALRDFGLSLGALALGKLAHEFENHGNCQAVSLKSRLLGLRGCAVTKFN